ncbi:MAG: hypothetical protein OXR67_01060 [Chloroflexota bacterium]|nr:hypothetical protein [Chloroflexota bacterium]
MKPNSNVQSFRITDALRCTLLNAPGKPNLACPRPALNGDQLPLYGARLWRNAVMQPRNRLALARWQGTRLTGLVSARTRSGPRAWEVDGLYLPAAAPTLNGKGQGDDDYKLDQMNAEALALLEDLFQAVGERSGERIFLRLPTESPTLTLARRSGFIVACNETLVEGPGSLHLNGADGETADHSTARGLRTRLPSDEYGVFQLYCASVPARVRQAMGLTFDQWRDGREAPTRSVAPTRQQEWVAEESGRIVGWVRLAGRGKSVGAEVMAHPDNPDQLFRMVDFASRRYPGLRWLVPDYQSPVRDRLTGRGGRQLGEYTMMVKMVAVPALEYGMAPVEA